MSKSIIVSGPAGRIEAAIARAPRNTRRAAVLCHPHPQFGGSMHDAVLDAVESVFLAEGVDCLRFNFRGVGNSEGSFDGSKGETNDALAVLGWARDNIQHMDELWLAGYSFGANIAWRAGQATDDLDRIFLVAPPIGRMEFAGSTPNIPVHIFGGEDDEFIDWAAADTWMQGRPHNVEITRLPGVDHFFRSGTDGLTKALRAAARARQD